MSAIATVAGQGHAALLYRERKLLIHDAENVMHLQHFIAKLHCILLSMNFP